MDVLSQVVSQLLYNATQLPTAPDRSDSGDDFNTLIQNKYQEKSQQATNGSQPEESRPVADKTKTEADTETSENAVVADPQEMQRQYEMVAALTVQVQPVVTAEPQVELQSAAAEIAVLPVDTMAADTPSSVPARETTTDDNLVEASVASMTHAEAAEAVTPIQPVAQQTETSDVELPVEQAPRQTIADDALRSVEPQEKFTVEVKDELAQAPVAQDVKTDALLQEEPAVEMKASVTVSQNVEAPQETDEDMANVPAETAVFGELDAVPVKVAQAPEEPVPLESKDAPELIEQKLPIPTEQGTSHIEINLQPENLGKLTVAITRAADGALSVVLSASTMKAAALLQQHSSGLQNLLAENNQAKVEIEVRGGEETQQQFLNPNDSNGREQQQQRQPHHQQQEQPSNTIDFLQQLRLGLVSMDEFSA